MNLDLDSLNTTKIDRSKIINAVLIIAILLFSYFIINKNSAGKALDIPSSFKSSQQVEKIDQKISFIDIEGAVINPGVYEIEQGKRINDAVILAGGFAKDVDYSYVIKNINKAQKVTDGMKIYIPFQQESLQAGTTPPSSSSGTSASQETTSAIINMNTASKSDLDKLPGIGEVTANKIIESRPYSSLEDIVSKKVLTSSQAEKIKDLVAF